MPRLPNWFPLLLVTGLVSWSAIGGEPTTPVDRPVGYHHPRPFNLPFLIRPESWYSSREQGMLMLCPAHAHGSRAEAAAELIRLVALHRSPAPATIWVCRVDQLNVLHEFAAMVDRICINPFASNSTRGEPMADPPWAGTAHPLLRQFQDIRRAAPDRQLVACIETEGQESRFGKRHPTMDEMQWMVLATIGSSFQGIAWRGDVASLPYSDRLASFTGNLLRYANEVSRAEPVDWAAVVPPKLAVPEPTQQPPDAGGQGAPGQVPCSALLAKSQLFVVLLHPQVMVPDPGKTEVHLPLSATAVQECRVAICPPPGVSVASVVQLDGSSLVPQSEGDRVVVSCRFAGGGTLLVYELGDQR